MWQFPDDEKKRKIDLKKKQINYMMVDQREIESYMTVDDPIEFYLLQ